MIEPEGTEVRSEYFFGTLQVSHRNHFYKAADGTTYVTLTLAVPREQLESADGKMPRPDLL